ncbi:MAG: hypothetical protein QOE10_3002, partial [Gaiellales bacterium]|nr:hypothetical protein [Gaiellales bacterium]
MPMLEVVDLQLVGACDRQGPYGLFSGVTRWGRHYGCEARNVGVRAGAAHARQRWQRSCVQLRRGMRMTWCDSVAPPICVRDRGGYRLICHPTMHAWALVCPASVVPLETLLSSSRSRLRLAPHDQLVQIVSRCTPSSSEPGAARASVLSVPQGGGASAVAKLTRETLRAIPKTAAEPSRRRDVP